VFRTLLGPPFETLPRAVQDVHAGEAEIVLHGVCDIERGHSLPARLMGAIASLLAAGRAVPTVVRIRRDARGETWTREFAGRRMRSVLRARDGFLEERLGPMTFQFALGIARGALHWRLAGVRVLGVPLPLAWFRGVEASEHAQGGAYRFEVRAAVAGAGLLVRYRGSLARR